VLFLFPAFLLARGPAVLAPLGLLGLLNAGWYAILKGRLYSALPGQSGTAMTVNSVFGLLHHLLPLGIGLAAQRFGLGAALWLLLLGPAALLAGLPRQNRL
jgi:FSR family fosmidomycin resistance protein-like MFS transporter